MNIKAATKYQIYEYKKAIQIFYMVVILVMVLSGVISALRPSTVYISMGRTEMATIIFLFICGLNSFKEAFLMMLQNSTTRKTMFISRLITILITGMFMAIIDRFVVHIAGLQNIMSERFNISGMYELIFNKRAESLHAVTFNLEAILITMGVYIAAIIGGYLITAMYYRMSKLLKVLVSVGVPITFLILLPLFDMVMFNGKLTAVMSKMFIFIFGGETGNPYNLLLSCVLFVIVGVGLSWLLIRKAVEKN